jgi:predicted transposase YbfD/YdcC
MKPSSIPAPLSPGHSQALQSLRERFAALPDSRVPGRTLHRLDEVLMIAFCSLLSDNDGFTDMEIFAQTQLPWLRTFLPLENGAPSHDVFRNVFMMLRPQALVSILQEWCGDLCGKHIAIDGKALRGTYDAGAGKCLVHVLRAWVSEMGLSAGQVTCAEKSNEIEALPRLLDSLQLKGAVVTIDAMGCQQNIARQIHEAGGDYILTLKANQKSAHAEVEAHFNAADEAAEAPSPHKTHESLEFSHGRFERREYTITSELDWFLKSWKWYGLQSVVRVRRWTHRGQQSAELALETHYYISSLRAETKPLAALIRRHWSVENQCHYVLDVTYNEDHCQVRDAHAAHNLSIVREITAKVLKLHPSKASLRAKRKRAALDPAFRADLLALIPHTFGA